LAVLFSLFLFACSGGGEKLPPVNIDLSESGPYLAGAATVTLHDTSRPTMANGIYPGDVSRTLVVDIRYPSTTGGNDAPLDLSGGPYPLIVLSHGFMAQGRLYSFFTKHLASYGYVTAAPDFPLTNITAPGGSNPSDVINQPGDVSFVMDRMLDSSATPGNLLAGSIDPDRIGVAGHSLGGFTTLLVSFSPDYGDDRIKASMPMAPMGCPFQKDFFRTRPVPLMLAGGTEDIFVTFPENLAAPYKLAVSPKYLLEVTDGTHMSFCDMNIPEYQAFTALFSSATFTDVMAGQMDDLLNSVGSSEQCAGMGVMSDPGSVQAPEKVIAPDLQRKLVKIYGTAFFEIYLKGKEEYKYFFTDNFTKTTPEAVIHKDN
jgi:dienelactone hydrolase